LPPRDRRTTSRNADESRNRRADRQPVVSRPPATSGECNDDDGREVDDVEKVQRENPDDRLLTANPQHAAEHNPAQYWMNAGSFLCYV